MKKYIKHIIFIAIIAVLLSGCITDPSKKTSSGSLKEQEDAASKILDDEPVIKLYDRPADPEEDVEVSEGDKASDMEAGSDDHTGEQDVNTEENTDKENGFYITEITDDIFERIYGKSFKADCTLPREDLRYLHVLNKDINGTVHEGEMIVNKHIAEDVLEILRELYENDYPIEKVRLVDEYNADDDKSMEDNNSSGFNYRTVPGSKKMSKHSMGLAVDINTRYNPYVRTIDGQRVITPVNGIEYADREMQFDYKIEKGDLCYDLFTGHGFTWGGEWKNSKDYQHFEIPETKIKEWYP